MSDIPHTVQQYGFDTHPNRVFVDARDYIEIQDALEMLRDALLFYAEPETYFAVGFFPDPPCGEFMNDFSNTEDLGRKPGKLARETLDKLRLVDPPYSTSATQPVDAPSTEEAQRPTTGNAEG